MIRIEWRYLGMVLLVLPVLVEAAYTGSGWRVGLIDTGVFKHPHPQEDQGEPLLIGKLVNEKCHSIADNYFTQPNRAGGLTYIYTTASTCRNGKTTDNTTLTPSFSIGAKTGSGTYVSRTIF